MKTNLNNGYNNKKHDESPNKKFDERLYNLVDSGHLNEAREIVFTYIQQYQNAENFVILFILFKIRDAELASGEPDIFSSPAGSSVSDLIKHYTLIKFYLRRYEYDMPNEAVDEAFRYFTDNKVSVNALYKIAEFACVDRISVYQRLADSFRYAGMTAQATALDNI